MQPDLFTSARDKIAAIRDGHVTARKLLEDSLLQFRRINPDINAVIRTDLDTARKHATRLDELAAAGEWMGPLHGLPITVKDTFDVDGMPASAGAEKYARRAPHTRDAYAVGRLKSAGAVIWGKSNTPYLAGDNQTFNTLHGITNNPYNPALTPGGSSGGSAAAIASGISALELGSDIGGSLRLPAHFCGVCALKPSYGRISQIGHVPPEPGALFERQLNVVGPLARNVADLKLAFSVLTNEVPIEQDPVSTSLRSRRIAIWSEEEGFSLSADCAQAVERAAQAARKGEASVAKAKPDIAGPHLLDVYLRLVVAVLSEDMPASTRRFLSMYRPIAKLIADEKPFSRAKWSLYATSRYRDWVEANEMRAKLLVIAERFFRSWDAIIAPVCAVSAFPHDHRGGLFNRRMIVDGRKEPYVSYLSWISLASACNLPAVVIPAGRTSDGMPVGVQVIGAHGQDQKVLDIAEALEANLGGFTPPKNLQSV